MDRRDAAIRQATSEKGGQIADFEAALSTMASKNAKLESNARALGGWKEEFTAMKQVQEEMVVQLDTAKKDAAASEERRVIAEAQVSRMKELYARFSRDIVEASSR
ncbi:uncharacterized protein RSE6_04676 [Rhynchosporium secalis]|uniref:Uncharacterized protein n=1 Tax=Rhynchosporium secalis TaxID=38038 RepID=A0A1E1M5W6_RHYSE|nr:uncharacterized protein RSE6_04676 [Rhynchosporium secalis]